MRKLKQLCIATVLTLTLSFTAFAGNIDTPGVKTPPPPPDGATVAGITDTAGLTASETSSSETVAMDSMTELALYLFDSMTSIF